ncbi:hypothetical protein MO867_14090 [Microbulbifer sp. OS29]|uniref:F5/8 type C domain-containing protein n=1 Tax=Microbulbifer okhotskensis TaxID=2926617 RepID=A0A9X2EQH1_9GAMM|nr:hypothetical protein [Microbulbifer okhotskensis]MCO1335465.1 hypothetical protein [Microbulbifer okhotskensis]
MSIYQQGVATNHIDLLDQVVRLVTGSGVVSNLSYSGTGNGQLHNPDAHPAAVTESWSITCTDATAPAIFSVQGSVSGLQSSATVGTHYDNALVLFDLSAGDSDFQVGDKFVFDVTAGEMPADERWEVLRIGGVAEISASSYRVNYEPWQLLKTGYNVPTNPWATALGEHSNCWVGWKFFRPAEINRLVIQCSSTNSQAPKEFSLEWSDDGVNWNTREIFNGYTWANNETKELTITGESPGAKLYWRIVITENNGSSDTTSLQRISFPEFQDTADINFGRLPAVWLRAPGLTGNGPAYIAFQIYDRPTDDYYNWAINIGTGFVRDADQSSQPGVEAGALPLWNQDIAYKAGVDGQHIELVVQFDTVTFPLYVGKFLPYGTPGQYPYPAIIATPLSQPNMTRYSHSSVILPFKGNRDQLKIRTTSGDWINPYAWPYSSEKTFRDTGGEYPLLPIVLYDTENTYGTLDGMHFITGFDNAAGNTVSVESETHTVFSDGALTGFNDYYCMRTQ